MNIFILDLKPKKAAEYHCDKHVVKMIVEYAQLLSTCHRYFGDEKSLLYKKTHVNHPSNIWVRESKSNYNWLYQLFKYLSIEYQLRYFKVHYTTTLLSYALKQPPKNLQEKGLTNFALAMPDVYKDSDPVKAYRNFYIFEKYRFATWRSPRSAPDWFKKGIYQSKGLK